MSEQTQIVQAFLPNLVAGEYTVDVKQEVKSTQDSLQKVAKQLTLGVDAARFTLNKEDIYSVYPPENTTGQYADHLPHIVFNRRTLPWERTIDGSLPKDQTNPVPWMALLLLDEEDMKTLKIEQMPLEGVLDLQQTDNITRPDIGKHDKKSGLKLMAWEKLDQQCLVIDLSKEQYQNYLPKEGDLPYLAHSKIVTIDHKDPNGIGDVVDSVGYFSVLTSNKIVRKNQAYTAVVVSLEGHQNHTTIKDKIRMVALAHWSFISYGEITFETLVKQVKIKNMTLTSSLEKGHRLEKHLAHGFVPMRHQMRNGAKNISWYRSPFVPNKVRFSGQEFIKFSCSDTALYYDTETGFLDISIAAAWELGKIMALNHQEFTKAMVAWNHDPIQDEHITNPENVKKGQLLRWLNGQPQPKLVTASNKTIEYKPFPEVVKNHLTALARLEGIPLSYLIPDEKYIQSENASPDAMVLFYIDPKWIFALLDGAVSLSRRLLTDTKTQVESIIADVYGADYVTGFLLHSKLVSGWRGVEIQAFDTNGNLLSQKIRFERITPDIFLGVFLGEISKIVVTQPYEGLHFGIKEQSIMPLVFEKAIKTREGVISEDQTIEIKEGQLLQQGYVLAVNQLADALKNKTQVTGFTSAEYAYQMIDSPIEATFNIHYQLP